MPIRLESTRIHEEGATIKAQISPSSGVSARAEAGNTGATSSSYRARWKRIHQHSSTPDILNFAHLFSTLVQPLIVWQPALRLLMEHTSTPLPAPRTISTWRTLVPTPIAPTSCTRAIPLARSIPVALVFPVTVMVVVTATSTTVTSAAGSAATMTMLRITVAFVSWIFALAARYGSAVIRWLALTLLETFLSNKQQEMKVSAIIALHGLRQDRRCERDGSYLLTLDELREGCAATLVVERFVLG